MSDAAATAAPAVVDKPVYTEKEIKLITAAMVCLKSGPPEIDMQKFMIAGGFNTAKTAQNTWGVLKKKIAAQNVVVSIEQGDTGSATISSSTEKKTPKKRTKKEAAGEDDAEAEDSPAKKVKKTPTPRKSAAQKKADAAGEAGEDDGEEAASGGSPVKKTRAPRKSPVKKTTAAAMKAEADAIKEEAEAESEMETEIGGAAGEDSKMEEFA